MRKEITKMFAIGITVVTVGIMGVCAYKGYETLSNKSEYIIGQIDTDRISELAEEYKGKGFTDSEIDIMKQDYTDGINASMYADKCKDHTEFVEQRNIIIREIDKYNENSRNKYMQFIYSGIAAIIAVITSLVVWLVYIAQKEQKIEEAHDEVQ